jgi:ABC-2 type transport system permease protein
MRIFATAGVSFLRIVRDRTALFFIVILPILVILIVGVTVGGFGEFRVGVVDQGGGELAQGLLSELDGSPAIKARPFSDADAARTALRRGEISAVVVVPAGLDARLRRGQSASITVYADPANSGQQAAFAAVAAVVADHASTIQAAAFATEQAGGSFDANVDLAREAAKRSTPIAVKIDTVNAESRFLPEGFSYSAPTMLVLFVFITALAGGGAMIQTRRLGIYERMLAGPVTTRSIVLGETLVYFGLAVFQSLLIVGIGAVFFNVDWGDPLAAAALIGGWALVGTGAGMLSGSLFRTPEQASSIGPAIGMAFGMLGGTMWPLEIVPEPMRVAGHAVPHAWAVDGWTTLLSRGGGVGDIATDLAVLTAFAVVLLGLAITRLRRRMLA